jgi:hypothetical protein
MESAKEDLFTALRAPWLSVRKFLKSHIRFSDASWESAVSNRKKNKEDAGKMSFT